MSEGSPLPVVAVGGVLAGPALWQFVTDPSAPLTEIALKVGAAWLVAWVAVWFYDSLTVPRRDGGDGVEGAVVGPAADASAGPGGALPGGAAPGTIDPGRADPGPGGPGTADPRTVQGLR